MGSRYGSATLHAPDPAPARALRVVLEQERRRGTGFPVAWRLATMAVLTDLPAHERRSWSKVFHGTRQTWARAYAGLPDGRRALFAVHDDHAERGSRLVA